MAGKTRRGVYPHGNDGWRFQVKDPATGRWKQLRATRARFEALGVSLRGRTITKTDACRLKEAFELHLHQAAANGSSTDELHLSKAIEEYLRYQRNTPEFLQTKRRVLQEFTEVVGDQPVGDVTKAHILRFEEVLREDGRKHRGHGKLHPTSVSRYLRYVRTFFSYATSEGWLHRSPFTNFVIPSDESTPIQTYTLDEIGEIIASLRVGGEGREYAVWMIAGFLGLGLRSMEIQGLDWSDVDLDKRFVHISKTKNPESRRPQPIPQCLVSLFEDRRREQGPLFPNQQGERASRNQMSSLARRIAKQWPGFNWQRLRRTYATLLQTAGVDALIIDRLLGHSSKSSTIRVSATHYIGKEYTFYRGLWAAARKRGNLALCS